MVVRELHTNLQMFEEDKAFNFPFGFFVLEIVPRLPQEQANTISKEIE